MNIQSQRDHKSVHTRHIMMQEMRPPVINQLRDHEQGDSVLYDVAVRTIIWEVCRTVEVHLPSRKAVHFRYPTEQGRCKHRDECRAGALVSNPDLPSNFVSEAGSSLCLSFSRSLYCALFAAPIEWLPKHASEEGSPVAFVEGRVGGLR